MNVADAPQSHPLAPAPSTPASTRLPRGVVFAFLLLTSFGTGVVLSILGPTVPAIAAHLGVPEAVLGLVFTANFIAATVTTAATGPLFNRLGARLLLPAGLAVMAAGLAQEGTAGTLPLVALGGVLAGLGTGVINVAVSTVAARLYPDRRGSVLTWLNVCFGTGAFLTPLAASLALARLGGYAPAFLAGAAVLVLAMPPLLYGLPAASAEERRPAAASTSVRSLLRDPNLRLLMALAGVYLGAEIGFGGWVISIVATMTRLSPVLLAPTASAFWIALAAGGAPTVLLLRRGIPTSHLILYGALSASAGALLLLVAGSLVPLAIVSCALIGLSFAPILPLATALATRHGPGGTADGVRVAALFTTGQVGAATLPALQGALLSLGPRPALGLTLACALAMAALARALIARESATYKERPA